MCARGELAPPSGTGRIAWRAVACLAVLLSAREAAAADLTLSLEGAADGVAQTTLTNVVGGSGQADFGTVNTISGTQPPGAGERVRIVSGRAGSHFVATLLVTVSVANGTGSETVTVTIQQTPGALPAARTRYALGTATNWSVDGAGIEVPVGTVALGSSLPSGATITHQIAILALDSDPAASYTVGIAYVATIP